MLKHTIYTGVQWDAIVLGTGQILTYTFSYLRSISSIYQLLWYFLVFFSCEDSHISLPDQRSTFQSPFLESILNLLDILVFFLLSRYSLHLNSDTPCVSWQPVHYRILCPGSPCI